MYQKRCKRSSLSLSIIPRKAVCWSSVDATIAVDTHAKACIAELPPRISAKGLRGISGLSVRASAFTISIRTCSLVLYDLDSNRGALASTISNSTHGQFADKTMSAWPLNEHMPKSTTSMCRYRAQKRPAYRGLLFSVLSLRGRVLLRRAWPSRRRALLESFSVYR